MISQEIRRKFLNYFKKHHHTIVPSASVIPHEDPTLLFHNSGMSPFKDIFLGRRHPDYKRAVTAQKCIRVGGKHNDLDNVGHTKRHLTFFEMLGNFSFGDYFKEQAIAYAWEVATQVFAFEPERIWITVFEEDEESFELWKRIVDSEKIVRMTEKDNFWSMGEIGPCGPCSELYYDKGEKYSRARSPKEDEEATRFLEFWNLVFMQYNRDAEGKFLPLPKKAIDTGAGLERIVSLKMGVDSVFQTDILRGLIAAVENVSGKVYERSDAHLSAAFHVIADHVRTLGFAIADGVQPSNVERGYVLRKVLRRAVRYGRMLGMQRPFLSSVFLKLIDLMGEDYPELSASQRRVEEILTQEEEAFFRTLKRGGNILYTVIEKAEQSAQKQISGEDAFKLKDTYGFPLEEIMLIAKDAGVQVNLDAYALLENQAKERSRSTHASAAQEVHQSVFTEHLQRHGPSAFLGYTEHQVEAKVLNIVVQGAIVQTLQEGEEGIILLDQTPFYAEQGGQVGDTGSISAEGAHFEVRDCRSPYTGVIAHIGMLTSGSLRVGQKVTATIDSVRRQKIANNHTATHLLHFALRSILGEHIKQAGSVVEPDRLRFDFNHHKALSKEQIREVERRVNEKIRENASVKAYEIAYEDAQKHKDIKQFFGEKYKSIVRVIDIDYSKELCGGTHTHFVGTIGLFRIAKETSISAGVRRIEALTGKDAEDWMYASEDLLEEACASLKSTPAHLLEQMTHLLEENKTLCQKQRQWQRESLKHLAKEVAEKAQKVGEHTLVSAIVPIEPDLLRELLEEIFSHLSSAVILLAAKGHKQCQLVVKISSDLVQKGVNALELIREISPFIEGGGGGKENYAQAGGKKPEGLAQALEQAKQWLEKKL